MEPEEQGSTLTSIVGQPPVAPALEVGAVELCALLSPEVPHAVWAALHENVSANVGTREAAILPYPPSMSWSPGGSCASIPFTVPGGATSSPPRCLAGSQNRLG